MPTPDQERSIGRLRLTDEEIAARGAAEYPPPPPDFDPEDGD